ncbi:MAG: hypothetical protein Q7R91_00590 [bacterium]|nr:hypothetical protein [bacterium]
MSEFLKKIVSPARTGEARKKIIIQDIIPKKVAQKQRTEIFNPLKAPKKEIKQEEPQLQSTLKNENLDVLPELTIKKWRPKISSFFYLKNISTSKRSWIFILLAAISVLFIILSTVFAKLTITLRPVSAQISMSSITITADAKILALNLEAKKLPALKIEIKKTYQETFTSSGKKYVEDYARGRITVFNAYSSAPQALVAGTRFVTPDAKTFKLVKSVTIPGAKVEEGKIIPSSIVSDVIADKAGEDYNIAPTNFSIPGFKGTPKYTAFYAKLNDQFSGGFKGQASVITTADIKNAQEKVSQALFEQLKAALSESTQAGQDFISLEGSRNIMITDMQNPKPDEHKDNFSVSSSGVAQMIYFKKSDLLALLGKVLLSPDRPSTILENSLKPIYKKVRLDVKNGQLSFELAGEALAVRDIQVDDIISSSVSKKTSELEAYLRNRPEIAGFVINNFPLWRWKTPKHPEAIKVNIELPAVE